MSDRVKRAQTALEAAEARMQDALGAIESASEDISDEDLAVLNTEFDAAEAEHKSAKATLEREERVAAARAALPAPVAGAAITVGTEERAYRPDTEASYFGDLLRSRNGDREAIERLHKNNQQVAEARKARGEVRAQASGAGFLPPVYLADEWVKVPHPGRPFANALPKMDLPPAGTAISYPVVSGAAAVDFHADGGNVDNTGVTTTTRTSNLYAIAGMNDIDRLVLEKSFPGLDMVIFDDLRRLYDAKVDSKLINGSGTGEFLGLANVSGITTVTGSVSNQKATLQNIYQAISNIYENRYLAPDMILMHPRRAAWLASGFDSTFPIFNQGGMNAFQVGAQDGGFAGEIAGLKVVVDPNVPTNLGAGTNEDPVYVLVSSDLRLAEEGVQSATFEEVSSGTLAIRLQLWGYAAAILDRYPKGIAYINGLTAPSGF